MPVVLSESNANYISISVKMLLSRLSLDATSCIASSFVHNFVLLLLYSSSKSVFSFLLIIYSNFHRKLFNLPLQHATTTKKNRSKIFLLVSTSFTVSIDSLLQLTMLHKRDLQNQDAFASFQ